MKIENTQEKITNEFVNKINAMLEYLNLTCDYSILENEDGTRYAIFNTEQCPIDVIKDVAHDYGLYTSTEGDKFYLIDVPP